MATVYIPFSKSSFSRLARLFLLNSVWSEREHGPDIAALVEVFWIARRTDPKVKMATKYRKIAVHLDFGSWHADYATTRALLHQNSAKRPVSYGAVSYPLSAFTRRGDTPILDRAAQEQCSR